MEQQGRVVGLETKFTETEDQLRLSVCCKGKLDSVFDLDALRDDYNGFRNCLRNRHVDDYFVEKFNDTIEKLRGKHLEDYIDWNNEPESGISYYVLTGLFLGFPHETTYSLIMG